MSEQPIELTVGLKERMARAGKLSFGLGKVVKNKYHNNPAKLAAWKVASHLERAKDDEEPPTGETFGNS